MDLKRYHDMKELNSRPWSSFLYAITAKLMQPPVRELHLCLLNRYAAEKNTRPHAN